MKILLGIPTNRMIKAETMMSLLNMVNNSPHTFVIRLANGGITITENRNFLAYQALQNDCDYCLQIDDDMMFPDDLLDKLLAHGKDIMGVWYHARMTPLRHTTEMFDELGQSNPFKVKALGGGILLIDCKVFKGMKMPYFDTEEYDTGMAKVSEDNWFCYRAREQGFEVWCDNSLFIQHIGDFKY